MGGERKEVEEGEGVWDVRGIESLYKVCHANPLWSPTEKREKESEGNQDVDVCSRNSLKDIVSNSLMVTSRAYHHFDV